MTIWPNTLLQPLDHIFGTALAAWLLPDVWERLQFNLCRFLMDRTSSCKLEVETLMCFFAYLVGSKKVLGHFWYLGSSWQADQLSMLGLKGFNQLVSISCRSGWPKSVSRWPIMFLSCFRYLLQYSDARPHLTTASPLMLKPFLPPGVWVSLLTVSSMVWSTGMHPFSLLLK